MKQHARTHTDLDAMLIGQKTVPKGCRVLNVSPQGMMLQCEPDGRLLTFRDEDLVDIHLTVHHGGSRKKFAIPAIVNRVDIKSIDVVFKHPNSELLKLIEAYRISDAHMMEASIALTPQEAGAKVSALPNTSVNAARVDKEENGKPQGSRKILYPVLATVILSVCIAAGAYLYNSGIDSRLNVLETITINQTNELAEIRSRVFSSSLQEGRYASLNARLQALTDAFGTLESKLDAVISGKPSPTGTNADASAGGKIASTGVETPVSITPDVPASNSAPTSNSAPFSDALPPLTAEESDSREISKPESPSAPELSAPETAIATTSQEPQPEMPGTASRSAIAVVQENATTQPENEAVHTDVSKHESISGEKHTAANVADKSVVTVASNSGSWIINLLSSRHKRDTDRLAELAASHDIPVIQSRAIVKGKEYWRLQVTGFSNATEAKDYAIPVKKKLGIKDVWIFQQKE